MVNISDPGRGRVLHSQGYNWVVAHSFSGVYVHVIFSTKNRQPFLKNEDFRQDVHRYLGGIAGRVDCDPLIVGGVEDHVHLLLHMGRTVAIAEVVRELKRGSTKWIREQSPVLRRFQWQSGYVAISVSFREISGVRTYIANQAEHHSRRSFQDEYRAILKKHGIAADETYMWE